MRNNSIIKQEQRKYIKEFQSILRAIKNNNKIVIFRHERPDFDALGTQLGLYEFLKDNFKDKDIIVVGDNHPTKTGLIYQEMDKENNSWYEDKHLSIVVDVNGKQRISSFKEERFLNSYTVVLDHHPLDERTIKYDVVIDAPHLAAASELIALMLLYFKDKYNYIFSSKCAEMLMSGIIGDTGSFKFSNTTPLTFEISKELTQYNFNYASLHQKIDEKSIDEFKLIKYVLSNTILNDSKEIAYYIINDEKLKEFNLTVSQGKISLSNLENIQGVKIYFSVTEDKKDKKYRLSLRSKEIKITDVAVKYGGGGHDTSCGGDIHSLDELPLLIKDLENLL